jgi:hypothetical protein
MVRVKRNLLHSVESKYLFLPFQTSSLFHMQSQMNLLQTLRSFFFRIHFNNILPSAHAIYNEFLRFIFYDWTLHMFVTPSVPSTCPVRWSLHMFVTPSLPSTCPVRWSLHMFVTPSVPSTCPVRWSLHMFVTPSVPSTCPVRWSLHMFLTPSVPSTCPVRWSLCTVTGPSPTPDAWGPGILLHVTFLVSSRFWGFHDAGLFWVSGEYYRRQSRNFTRCLGEETFHRSVMLVPPIGCPRSFQQSGFKATFTVLYCSLSCYPQHELCDKLFKTYINSYTLRYRGVIIRAPL